MNVSEALPHLSEEAQRRHATMVLGGWRFVKCNVGPSGGGAPWYEAFNPQGNRVAIRWLLLTAVDDAWEKGGNGK